MISIKTAGSIAIWAIGVIACIVIVTKARAPTVIDDPVIVAPAAIAAIIVRITAIIGIPAIVGITIIVRITTIIVAAVIATQVIRCHGQPPAASPAVAVIAAWITVIDPSWD